MKFGDVNIFDPKELPFAVRFIPHVRRNLLFPGNGEIVAAAGQLSPDPNPEKQSRLETSVYLQCTKEIDWSIGTQMYHTEGTKDECKTPAAALRIPSKALIDAQLSVEIEKNDYSDLHANILGWEGFGEGAEVIADKLQAQSELEIRPERRKEIEERAKKAQPRTPSSTALKLQHLTSEGT